MKNVLNIASVVVFAIASIPFIPFYEPPVPIKVCRRVSDCGNCEICVKETMSSTTGVCHKLSTCVPQLGTID